MSYMMPSFREATEEHRRNGFKRYDGKRIQGPRHVIPFGSSLYPEAFCNIPKPPECLYMIGNPESLQEGLAVIGARKATPYGLECARHFSSLAANRGVPIISGGAYGCDSEAHRAALAAKGMTVAFLGGGCDQPYPAGHVGLFQEIVDAGGAIVSEHAWDYPPLPFAFRARNRLIAGLAKATLIVEAGLPSGTFSTADEALVAGKEVLVIPGAITSPNSAGSNKLLYQGARPIVDDESFEMELFDLFGCLRAQAECGQASRDALSSPDDALYMALRAQPMRLDQILEAFARPDAAGSERGHVLMRLAELEGSGSISRYLDGRYGPGRL